MTTEHQTTREEEAFERLLKEKVQMLSEAGYTIIYEAGNAADAQYLGCTGYIYDPEEYVEAMKKMHLASAKLAGQDREILAELRHAAAAAAASIDPDDRTFVWRKMDAGDLHRYYKMISGMLEDTLREDAAEIIRDLEEWLRKEWLKNIP